MESKDANEANKNILSVSEGGSQSDRNRDKLSNKATPQKVSHKQLSEQSSNKDGSAKRSAKATPKKIVGGTLITLPGQSLESALPRLCYLVCAGSDADCEHSPSYCLV